MHVYTYLQSFISRSNADTYTLSNLTKHACDSACTVTITKCHKRTSLWSDIHNSYMKRCAEHGLEVYLNSCFVGRNTAVVEALSYTDLSLILNVQQSMHYAPSELRSSAGYKRQYRDISSCHCCKKSYDHCFIDHIRAIPVSSCQ